MQENLFKTYLGTLNESKTKMYVIQDLQQYLNQIKLKKITAALPLLPHTWM
jgi:hypothetical protein